MFCFYGILSNRAEHNVLAVPSLAAVDRWNQRWLGQAGLLSLQTCGMWSGAGIVIPNATYDAEFAYDIGLDI